MIRKPSLILLLAVVILTGCGPSKVRTTEIIASLEKQLYSNAAQNFNQGKADSLLMMYERFVKRYPKDTLAPKYLFHAAGLAMTLGDGKKSLGLYEQFMKDYPAHPKAPVCLFFKAYIYENLISNYDKAKETYLLFLEKYPDNEFARDARAALQNIGKTPEQLVREFEARKKAEEARKADSIASLKGKTGGKK